MSNYLKNAHVVHASGGNFATTEFHKMQEHEKERISEYDATVFAHCQDDDDIEIDYGEQAPIVADRTAKMFKTMFESLF